MVVQIKLPFFLIINFMLNNGEMQDLPFGIHSGNQKGSFLLVLSIFHFKFYYIVYDMH